MLLHKLNILPLLFITRWNPQCVPTQDPETLDTIIDCSQIVMSDGSRHVTHQNPCALCGLKTGAKVECSGEGCVAPDNRRHPPKFHVTCARQAGLEVLPDGFLVHCYNHVDCSFVFRARLEDMKEAELQRYASKTFKASVPMTWGHASTLFHTAVNILRSMGWAWRWAEWWVEDGDNWEPLLEEGEVEAEMTDAELKIVHSTPESRCEDARRCRLAAFGAALRNRDYDKEEGDGQEPLERALTAVLSTPSLVGPLKKKEIEFYVTWLALAYRSKSHVLGFGDDKATVAPEDFCLHQDDKTPKYELGSRPLPGKAKPVKGVFEPRVEETDDFLKSPISSSPVKKRKRKRKSRASNEAAAPEESAQVEEPQVDEVDEEEIDYSASPLKKKRRKKKADDVDDAAVYDSAPVDDANAMSAKAAIEEEGGRRRRKQASNFVAESFVAESEETWQCHCLTENSMTRKRCVSCLGWRKNSKGR